MIENNLTVATAAPLTLQPWNAPSEFLFTQGAKTVLRITKNGELEAGDGLAADEVSQGLFDILAERWPQQVEAWALARGWAPPQPDPLENPE